MYVIKKNYMTIINYKYFMIISIGSLIKFGSTDLTKSTVSSYIIISETSGVFVEV